MSKTDPETGRMKRRTFLGAALASAAGAACAGTAPAAEKQGRPNIVYVFGDQWRAQAAGYSRDTNVRTPNLDRLAAQSVNFVNAVSGCPVCSPYRASMLTGQYWHKHGVFLNDVPLPLDAVTIADVLKGAGYDTGYIGKWHVDGHGRLSFTPPERRHGFTFWRAIECTHDYNHSQYFADDPTPRFWEGYDAIAQTAEAQRYIKEHADGRQSFALFMSWGPPHNPYETAPKEYRDRIRPEDITLRPNVPADQAEAARMDLAGYYAHIMVLDDCLGRLMDMLDSAGIADNTIFVFTSDHGDMLHSQGQQRKQRPWDESIRVPFLLRYPVALGGGRKVECLLNTPDILPTLLGLCGVPVPDTVQGKDFSKALIQGIEPDGDAALIACITPFGEFVRKNGGKEYRGIRTRGHTYVRDLNGPWLLYDNATDPYQQDNLAGKEAYAEVQKELDARLSAKLKEYGDDFEPGDAYIRRFGYTVDATGTAPVHP